MRKLHLVGLTTDQKGLIFTARRGSDSGGYVVSLDAEVLNAIAKAQGRPNGAADGPGGPAGRRVHARARSPDPPAGPAHAP